jgi:hypothetical protein
VYGAEQRLALFALINVSVLLEKMLDIKRPLFFSILNKILRIVRKIILHESPFSVAELLHADSQRDGRTSMAKLIGLFS